MADGRQRRTPTPDTRSAVPDAESPSVVLKERWPRFQRVRRSSMSRGSEAEETAEPGRRFSAGVPGVAQLVGMTSIGRRM